MPEALAQWIVMLALAYAGVGLVFALAFVSQGVGRLDPDAARGSLGFRVLILPAAAALWPLLWKMWRARSVPRERSPHRPAARGGES